MKLLATLALATFGLYLVDNKLRDPPGRIAPGRQGPSPWLDVFFAIGVVLAIAAIAVVVLAIAIFTKWGG